MESDPLYSESPASLNSSSNDFAASIQKRDEIIKELQDKIKQLLKVKKRNEKLEKCIKALQEKYKAHIESVTSQVTTMTKSLDLLPDSNIDTILEKVNNIKQSDRMMQNIQEIFGLQSTDRNSIIQKLKDEKQNSDTNDFLVQNISKILGSPKDLISNIKDLQNSKNEMESCLKTLHLKSFNDLIQKQKQISSLLGFDQIQSQEDLLSSISNLQENHNEVMKNISSILPSETEYKNPQQIREALLNLKNSNEQNKNGLIETEKQIESLKSEVKKDQDLLYQYQCSSMDELSSVINDVIKTTNATSLKSIKPELAKLFADKEKLETMNKSISKELDNIKSQYNETNSQLTMKIDEIKNLKTKIDELDMKRIESENEKNQYKAMIPDKDEEINSLRALLQSNKGSVQKTFDEMNEQMLQLKSKIRKLTEANENLSTKILDTESKNKQLTFEVNSLNEDNQSLKKSNKENMDMKNDLLNEKSELEKQQKELKDQLESNIQEKEKLSNQLEKQNNEFTSQIEKMTTENQEIKNSLEQLTETNQKTTKELTTEKDDLNKKLTKIEKEISELNETNQILESEKSELQSNKEKLDEKMRKILKILNINEIDQAGKQVEVLLNENKQLKQTNKEQNDNLNELNNERDQIFSLLNITDKNCAIADTISDLVDNQKELKTENQDLTQKMSTIANFLNIENPQSATFPNIQKTIRNLQKQSETAQKENKNLNQKYEELLEIQKQLQKSTNSDNPEDIIQNVSDNEEIISQAMEKLKIENKSDLITQINRNEEILQKISEELGTDKNNLVSLIQSKKNQSTKLAKLLNTSEENVQKAVEDNQAFIQNACKSLNCEKESALKTIQSNSETLQKLAQMLNTNQIDQIPTELSKLMNDHNALIQTKNEIESKLQNEINKNQETDKLLKEFSTMLNLKASDDYSTLKPALQTMLDRNKQMESIQKVLSDQNNMSELPSLIQNYQNDHNQLKQIQSILETDDVLTAVNSMNQTLKRLYSLFNIDKNDELLKQIESNVEFANTIQKVLEEQYEIKDTDKSTMTNLIAKKLEDHKNIENLLNSSSPFEAIQNILNQNEKGVKETTENELRQILGINENADLIQTVQNDQQTKKELFELLGVQNTDELIEKAKELSNIDRSLKAMYPNEKNSQKAFSKLENERKEFCKSLNCNDLSLLDEVKKLQAGMKDLNDAYNSDIDMTSNPENLIQTAKASKQLFKKLMKTFDSNSLDEVDQKVHQLKKENDEIHSLLNTQNGNSVELVSNMLNSLNASSYSDFIGKLNSLRDQVQQLSQQNDMDNSIITEFMTDSEMKQIKNGDRLHFILNKLKKEVETQKNLIDKKDSDNIQKDKMIEQKDFELTEILKLLNVPSSQFAIDVIKDLKRQINELEKEISNLNGCKAVEESLKAFEDKENRFFQLISTKLNEISNLLNTFLSSVHASKGQKNEMKSLIEKALIESQTLREMILNSNEKWALFGGKKQAPKVPTATSENIRIKQKEIKDAKKKVAKAEQTSMIQYMRENPNQTLI